MKIFLHKYLDFTQSDVEVNDNYMERYSQVFKPTEVKMMMSAFSNIETVHICDICTSNRNNWYA